MQVMIQEDTTPLILIHLEYQREGMEYERDGPILRGKQSWAIACAPNLVHKHATMERGAWQRTNDPRAVTCPTCKETEIYLTVLRRFQTMGKPLT